jgi:hypothetical protein
VVPVIVEGLEEHFDRLLSAQHHRVVRLHEEPTPRKIRGSTDGPSRFRTVDDDRLVVLKLAHVLPFHVGGACRRGHAHLRLRLGRPFLAVRAVVVDDQFQSRAELLETRDDLRLVQVERHHSNLRFRVGDRLVEEIEDRLARLESHPRERLVGQRMRRLEGKPSVRVGRQQRRDVAFRLVSIDERLRRHEATRKRHVELAGICFTPQLDRGLLEIAVAQFVGFVHEDRRHAVHEFAGQLGVAREMNPPEFLDRRKPSRELIRIDRAARSGEAEAILQREELNAARLLVFDREPDETGRWLPFLPVHREERHPVAAMDFQGEERSGVGSTDLKVSGHVWVPTATQASRPLTAAREGRPDP